LKCLIRCIDRGLNQVKEIQEEIGKQVQDIRSVYETLDPKKDLCDKRQARFNQLKEEFQKDPDPARQQMACVMENWEKGLFAGGDDFGLPRDNLDLERFFKLPKSHERRLHGRAHAGIRIVQEGPSLLLVLNAHLDHPQPLSISDLIPYRDAKIPTCQKEALDRRKIMRKARSKKQRPLLLAELEKRYLRSH